MRTNICFSPARLTILNVSATTGPAHWRTAGGLRCALVVCAALVSSGCNRQPPAQQSSVSSQSTAETPKLPERTFSWNAGDLLAGELARHDFIFSNDTGSELSIDSDRDIASSCSCAKPTIDKKHLKPGELTTVHMAVSTAGRNGLLQQRVNVNWHDPAGARVTSTFELSATVSQGLVVDPGLVTFQDSDIDGQVNHPIRLTASVPVDWKTLKIHSTNPAFRLAPTQVSASEVKTTVRCTLPDRVTDLKGFLSISVERIGHPETPGADRLTGEVSLSARRTVEFAATPSCIPIILGEPGANARASVLLTGKRVADPSAVQAISIRGHLVTWTERPSAAGSKVVLLTIPKDLLNARDKRPLVIVFQFKDGTAREVPALLWSSS